MGAWWRGISTTQVCQKCLCLQGLYINLILSLSPRPAWLGGNTRGALMTRSHPGFFWKLSLGFGVPGGAKTAGVLLGSEVGEKRDPQVPAPLDPPSPELSLLPLNQVWGSWWSRLRSTPQGHREAMPLGPGHHLGYKGLTQAPAVEGNCSHSCTCPGDAAFLSERNSPSASVFPPETHFSLQTILSMSLSF